MKKFLGKFAFTVLFFAASSSALTLDQVRADLKENSYWGDSVEMNLRTTTLSSAMAGKQVVDVYLVRKGPTKLYAELKMPLLNRRMIVNGNRMKSVDLTTRKSQISAYDGKALEELSYAAFNPLRAGDWQEPELVSGNRAVIRGSRGVLYYDFKKKRFDSLEYADSASSVSTDFSYDTENNLKTMTVSVDAYGIKTSAVTEILILRRPEKFPDRLFEF